MKSLNYIDSPYPCAPVVYEAAKRSVVDWILKRGFARAVYQVGGVAHPGISDIDLLIVAHDDSSCFEDPLNQLSRQQRYTFTHKCFLITESLLDGFDKSILLHGYRLIAGESVGLETISRTSASTNAVQRQIAFEFLVKNLFDLKVQLNYHIVKTRVFLQHLKGVRFDLDFLDIHTGSLRELINEGMLLIDKWFESRPTDLALATFIHRFDAALHSTLRKLSSESPLVMPSNRICLAPNMVIRTGDTIRLTHVGLQIPFVPCLSGRRQFNLRHKLNRFLLTFPACVPEHGSAAQARFNYLANAKHAVRRGFPHFSIPAPPLIYNAL